MRVLAGDIGGTKTAIATVEVGSSKLTILRERRYPSAGYPGLEEIVEDFLSGERAVPRAAAFGVAGPVRGGSAKVTKLPWVLEERRLARRLRLPRVRLLNDFAVAALGLPYLRHRQVAVLAAGEEETGGPIGILGAGTGLGQAALAWIGRRAWAFPSEGGHADFGPRDSREDRLVAFLRARFGRVDRAPPTVPRRRARPSRGPWLPRIAPP
jgi:glucokinase